MVFIRVLHCLRLNALRCQYILYMYVLVRPSVYSLEMTVDYVYNTEKVRHEGFFIINSLRSLYITTEISL